MNHGWNMKRRNTDKKKLKEMGQKIAEANRVKPPITLPSIPAPKATAREAKKALEDGPRSLARAGEERE